MSSSDALSQHLSSYLDFSYLRLGVSLHGCSSKVQPLLLTLDEGYLLMATPPDLEHGVAPLGGPVPMQLPLLARGVAPLGRAYARSVCSWQAYLECQVHESRQIGSGQTGDGKSECQYSRNQQTKID